MSSRRRKNIPLGGRYRQVSLYLRISCNNKERCPNGFITHAIAKFLNTSRPRQSGSHFAGDFQTTFFIRIFLYQIKLSLKFVPNGPALIQMMHWCRTSEKALFEPVVAYFSYAYICIYIYIYMSHSASMIELLYCAATKMNVHIPACI